MYSHSIASLVLRFIFGFEEGSEKDREKECEICSLGTSKVCFKC